MAAEKKLEYIEARVEVPSELTDVVCDFIIENITSGLVIEEEEESNLTGVIFYVPTDSDGTFRGDLKEYLSGLTNDKMPEPPQLRERTIGDIDWIEKYRESARPAWIGSDIVVRPEWHQLESPVKYDIIVEPRMAFGTGSHETTQTCLRIISEHFRPGMRFLDVGTGSGILSILADKVGASYIKAIDSDPVAIENCRENFKINGVSTVNDIQLGSDECCENDEPFQFVCANIIKSTILPMLPGLLSKTSVSGFLVLSGLLEEDRAEIEESLRQQGQDDISVQRQNEWVTYVIRRC
jgi:ribosomal protein L11 methyltransferase